MIIRNYPTVGLKDQKMSAQGIALGTRGTAAPPCKGKRLTNYHTVDVNLLPFQGDYPHPHTQGVALGYHLAALSGRSSAVCG